jgi:hypothetical protein
MITLYHYSQADFTGYIKPSFFGSNNYTNESRRLSQVNRIYFYPDINSREYFFNGSRFLYISEVNENKIYDLKADILHCVGKFNTVTEFIYYITGRGFIGFKDFNGRQNVICLFKAVKVIDKITLTK